MKHLFLCLFTLLSLASLGQNKVQKEINYIRSFRKESDKIIVELGNNPKLCFLRVKNNPNFAKYAALIKQHKLFEIGIEEKTNDIKLFRALSKIEEDEYKYLKPYLRVGVSAVATSEDLEKFYTEALAFYENKQYEDAIATINKAIIINTQNPEYHKLKAYCLAHLKQYKASTDEVKFALEMDCDNSELYEIIANNFYFLNDNENAIKNYEKAIEYETENVTRVYHNYVKCLIEIPNSQRAVAVYTLYQYRTDGESDYADGDLAFYAGQAYQQLKDYQHAADIYDRLTVMYPDVYGFYAQRGRLYQEKLDFPAAISDFETALKLNNEKSILLTNLAQIYLELHDYKKAAAAFQEYLSKNPDDAMQTGNYGYLLLDTEQYKEAQTMFEKSLALDNKNIDTYVGCILAAYLLGDTEKKNTFVGKATLQFPEIPINTTTLKALIKTGDFYYSERIMTVWEDAMINK
jgi:tetratricopeptide (TPR) repeat protein